MMAKENEIQFQKESLGGNFCVYVSKDHRFGMDSFLLSKFSAPKKIDRVCDLGTGCGIIPVALMKFFRPKHITAVEIQEKAAKQAELSFEESGLDEQITLINGDLKKLDSSLNGIFDVVVCNPPYKAVGTGKVSSSPCDKTARHETSCTIEDICHVSSKLLRFGGRLCFCQRAERLTDTLTAMRNAGIEPKKIQFCSKDKDTSPWMFLVEGKRGAKPFLQVMPPFFAYDEQGNQSGQTAEIYGL